MSDAEDRGSGRGQPNEVDHLDEELLSRLVDDDLAPEERLATGTHLSTCAACASRLDALRSTVTLLRGLPSPRPAQSFQLAPSHARPVSGWRRFSAWLPVGMPALRAGVVAVVLVVGGAAAFAAIQDGDDLGGQSTGNVESEPTVAGGDAIPTLMPTVPNAMLEQTQVEPPHPTATTGAPASRSGQSAGAAEIATVTPPPTQSVAEEAPPDPAAPDIAPTATSRPLSTATPERDTILGIEVDDSSDAAGDVVPATTATTASEADQPSDASSGDTSVSENADEAPADEAPQRPEAEGAPQDAEEGKSAPESSAAFAPATSIPSPSPTRRPTERPSTPSASTVTSPVSSPVASPVVSPVASPAARSDSIDGDITDNMPAPRIDELFVMAILLFAGGIVVAARATRGLPR